MVLRGTLFSIVIEDYVSPRRIIFHYNRVICLSGAKIKQLHNRGLSLAILEIIAHVFQGGELASIVYEIL
jgi:hypothetical protein